MPVVRKISQIDNIVHSRQLHLKLLQEEVHETGHTEPNNKRKGWSVKKGDASLVLANLLINIPGNVNGRVQRNKQSSQVLVKFNPYIHPTPGKSLVYVKVKGDKEKPNFFVEYNSDSIPNPNDLSRSQIKLPGISDEVVSKAKLLAFRINEEMKLLSSSRVKMKTFEEAFAKHLNNLDKNEADTNSEPNQELISLTAYFCLDKNGGFLSKLPDGLLEPANKNLPARVRALGRYFLVNKKNIDTAEKAESFTGWSYELPKANLTALYNMFSPADLLKISFPGYLDGPDPPIREWLIPSGVKWESNKELLSRACKNVFFAQGVVNPDLTVNVDEVLKRDWGQIINNPKNGLRGALAEGVHLRGALSAIKLAAPELIGIKIKDGQIPPWRFERLITWTGEEGLETLDELTRYIVEEKLKLFDDAGHVSAEKIRKVKDWNRQFSNENKGCLELSLAKTAEGALKRVYPDLFGWNGNQIQPGELKIGGKWRGKEGIKLFKLRFAKSIHTVFERLKESGIEGFKNHKVRFNPDSEPPLILSRHDFTKLINFYIENDINWWEHMLLFDLSGGFTEVVDRNLISTFEVLLGKINRKTSCFGDSEIKVSDAVDRNPTRTALITDLLSELNDQNEQGRVFINSIRMQEYSDSYTGIQGSCLEPLLTYDSMDNVSTKTVALYEAYAAAINPFEEGSREADTLTALERMLMIKYQGEEKHALGDKNLRLLLRILKNNIIPDLNINDALKAKLKDLLVRVLDLSKPYNTPRDVLLTAAKTNRKYGMENNALSLLNSIFEHIFEAIAIHEIRYLRIHGSNTQYYASILQKINEEDALVEYE